MPSRSIGMINRSIKETWKAKEQKRGELLLNIYFCGKIIFASHFFKWTMPHNNFVTQKINGDRLNLWNNTWFLVYWWESCAIWKLFTSIHCMIKRSLSQVCSRNETAFSIQWTTFLHQYIILVHLYIIIVASQSSINNPGACYKKHPYNICLSNDNCKDTKLYEGMKLSYQKNERLQKWTEKFEHKISKCCI